MYDTHCDKIVPGDNVIIGLGDSFTQGVGTYNLETWASIPEKPSTYNISGQLFLEEQGQNNYIRQLVNDHLPGYKTFNLGINGAGNRGAIKELYLNPLPNNLNNVVVILMCSGIERFDFLKKDDESAGINWHQKWQTIFPCITDRGVISEVDKAYFTRIYTPRGDAIEFLMNIKDAENFCKAHGYKFVFASAFDRFVNKDLLKEQLANKDYLIDMIDWNNFISTGDFYAIIDMVNQLECEPLQMWELHKRMYDRKMPTKYITPCCHWSKEGAKYVANFIFKELQKRELV